MLGLLSSTTGCVPTLLYSDQSSPSVQVLLKYISIESLEAAKRTPAEKSPGLNHTNQHSRQGTGMLDCFATIRT